MAYEELKELKNRRRDMKKSLMQKVNDYATKLLSICPNQKSVEVEDRNGIIILKTNYNDGHEQNVVEIASERELRQLKYYDKKDLKNGYLI